MDFHANDNKIIQHLVSKAVEKAVHENADVVRCNMIGNKTYFKAFKKNGFLLVPYIKHSWFCAYSRLQEKETEFLKTQKNWFIIPGDSDTI